MKGFDEEGLLDDLGAVVGMRQPRYVESGGGHSPSSEVTRGAIDGCPPSRTRDGDPFVSFVIPAHNEENLIRATIEAIHAAMAGRYAHEVIVVDNGSSDETARIAEQAGAKVISRPTGTIGALRNEGVAGSSGRVIVFLDADVVIKAEWSVRFPEVLERLEVEPYTIMGSRCEVPVGAGWIERSWFATPVGRSASHIGTGHMILTRRLFDDLQGFDIDLITGEDYDLSQRARKRGAKLVGDRRLRAEHMGYPSTIQDFLRREIWHGGSDFRSWRSFLGSRVAIAALVFLLLHIAFIVSALARWRVGALAALVGVLSMCVLSSAWQYRGAPIRAILANSLLFYLYYMGRAISAFCRPNASRTRSAPAP